METMLLVSLAFLAVGLLTLKVAVTLNVATDLLIYGPLMMLVGTVGIAVGAIRYVFALAI